MKRVVYVLTHDPKDRPELVSGVIAQAITALSFEYEAEIYLMDRAVDMAKKGYISSIKADSFAALEELISSFIELGGGLFVCAPSAHSHHIEKADCIDGVADFVDAGRLLVQSKDSIVFTY